MIRDRSNDGGWWLMIGLFTLCVVGWSLAFSLKAGAADSSAAHVKSADRVWQVSDFERIAISGSPDVQLVQGDAEGVYGTGDDDDLDRLDVFVEGRELVVRPRERSWIRSWSSDDVNLVIELRDLSRLKLSGAGDLSADGLESRDLALKVSGSSDIEIDDLSVRSLELVISGSADVELAGAAEDQVVRISGSADYTAAELESDSVRIRISGSADARVQANDTLEARVSGSGSVRYLGEPEISQQVSGSGDIRPL